MKKIYNYERPQTLEDGEVPSLSPVDAFGYQIIDDETGEVLASRGNWLQAVEQVGIPIYEEEVGEPLVVDFSKSRDLKARAMEMLGTNSIAGILGNDDNVSDEEAFKALDDLNDNEVDDFNNAMERTPYACDDKGVSNYEKAIIEQQQGDKDRALQELRSYMSQKDLALFDFLAGKSDDELRALGVPLDAAKAQTANTGISETPTQDHNGNTGEA